jgi:hypothetical protein
MHKCITTRIDSSLTDLFTTSCSPSHYDLCHFKLIVLCPLQWEHQIFSSFGFPTYPHSSRMCSPLSVWTYSNNISAFALDLESAYEEEHMIFGLLNLANLTQDDVLQFHPFTHKWQGIILLHGWVKFHCVGIPHFLSPFVHSGASWLFP